MRFWTQPQRWEETHTHPITSLHFSVTPSCRLPSSYDSRKWKLALQLSCWPLYYFNFSPSLILSNYPSVYAKYFSVYIPPSLQMLFSLSVSLSLFLVFHCFLFLEPYHTARGRGERERERENVDGRRKKGSEERRGGVCACCPQSSVNQSGHLPVLFLSPPPPFLPPSLPSHRDQAQSRRKVIKQGEEGERETRRRKKW